MPKRERRICIPNNPVGQLAQDYLEDLRARQASVRTVRLAETILAHVLAFLSQRERIQDITAADLEAYRLRLVQQNFSPASAEVYLRTVRQFFGWLEARQRLFINPAAGLLIPKPPRKLLPVPSEEDIRKLLAQPNVATPIGLRDRALLESAYATGARREELSALNAFDVDLDQQTVRVLGKGKKERVLPLGKQAAFWLQRYLAEARPKLLKERLDEPALWIDLHGKRLSYEAWQQVLRQHTQAAQLQKPISPHAIRRACATHMLRRGAHPLQLQMLLGHASLKTLSQYLRVTVTELQHTHAQSNPGR